MNTPNITITHTQALEGLLKAVEHKGPGYVYDKPGNSCLYIHNGIPSCLVGVALHKLGVPLEVLTDLNPEGVITTTGAVEVLEGHGVHIDPNALGLLDTAQMGQDGGTPWGHAVQAAISAVPA